jgi:hypothetical protein
MAVDMAKLFTLPDVNKNSEGSGSEELLDRELPMEGKDRLDLFWA